MTSVVSHQRYVDEEREGSSPQDFLDLGTPAENQQPVSSGNQPDDQLLISGAIQNDDYCKDNPQRPPCTTGSCASQTEAFIVKGTNDYRNKPLPLRPDQLSDLDPNKERVSQFNISADIKDFEKEVDTRFLDTVEQQVLQSLGQLSRSRTSRPQALVQLGELDTFWMSSADADILEKIQKLTEVRSIKYKERLVKDLDEHLSDDLKYPLQQVLFHGVHIKCRKPAALNLTADESPGDQSEASFQIIQEYEDLDDLRPSPLRIRKYRSGNGNESFQPHHLSRLTELSEPEASFNYPGPRRPLAGPPDRAQIKQPGSVGRARAGLVALPNGSSETYGTPRLQQNAPVPLSAETSPKEPAEAGGGSAGLLKSSSAAQLGLRTRGQIAHQNTAPIPSRSSLLSEHKRPGNVGRARAAVAAPLIYFPREEAQPLLESSLRSEQSSGSLVSLNGRDVKKQGSVRNARADMFMNPREAPKPPVKKVKPRVSRDPIERTMSLTQLDEETRPGHVSRARVAALLRQTSTPNMRKGLFESTRDSTKTAEAAKVTAVTAESNKLPFFRPSQEPHGYPKNRRIQASTRAASNLKKRSESGKPRRQSSRTAGALIQAASVAIRPSPARRITLDGPHHRAKSTHGILVTKHTEISEDPPSSSCLRGGADGDTEQSSQKLRRRRTIASVLGRVPVLEDDVRPPGALWWLAGGRTGGSKQVLTAGELRQRRKAEKEAMGDVVGFLGTVVGLRAVRRLPISAADERDDKEKAKAESDGSANDDKKDATEEEDDLQGEEGKAKATADNEGED